MIKITDKYIKIDSNNNTLLLGIARPSDFYGVPQSWASLLHYGKKVEVSDDCEFNFNPVIWGGGSSDDAIHCPRVISCTGDCNNRESLLTVVKDGVFTNRFMFVKAEMVDGFTSPLPTARKKGETVCLTYVDDVTKATLNQYYTVFADSDVIATHTEVVNTTDGDIYIDNLSSLQLEFFANKAEVISYDGKWVRERDRHETSLVAGKMVIESRSGISSPTHNPFFMAKVDGKLMGFNLVWSGNHKEVIEVSPYNQVKILAGMSDHGLYYKVKAGDKFVAPEAIFVCEDSEDEITLQMHKFSLNHIINPDFAYKERPVLINNWEGTYFNFTGDKIYDIAKRASECGIEMLVLDDGWFGKRDNDHSGLGDWYDNVPKTGGLKNLADKIHALGMKFGLWVEPEMICADSDLFRAHPEWAQAIPDVTPISRRYQLNIDIANPEVADYLADTLIKLFKDVGVDYVKWDHNRPMSDIYSSKLKNQGEYFYNYYVNQTAMLDKITKACPNVLFESCSSGGCRYDLGMQYFMPQNWGSDNTNAYDRIYIQEGTLVGYPQSSMGAHVASTWHSNNSIESRFNIAAIGAFGYEFDITKSTKEELSIIKKQVAYYKKHRKLLQYGNYYRLGESMHHAKQGGFMVVSDKKDEAIAVIIDNTEWHMRMKNLYQFKGLDDKALYKVTFRPQSNVKEQIEFTAYGSMLNNGGFDFTSIKVQESDRDTHYRDTFSSRMIYFKKIRK